MELTFNSLIRSFDANDIIIETPSGVIPANQMSWHHDTLTSPYYISFPVLTKPGQYYIRIGPQITNIYGQSMSSVYITNFMLRPPILSGLIANNQNRPIPGVTVGTADGQVTGITDANGIYHLELTTTLWTGQYKPSLPGVIVVPEFYSIDRVLEDRTNLDFVVYAEIPPLLRAVHISDATYLEWDSTSGINYQPELSTDLIHWTTYGQPIPGNNSVLKISLPEPFNPARQFFRLKVPLP
jgi:hypothetical protein